MESGSHLEAELQADERTAAAGGSIGEAFDLDAHLAHADHALQHLEGLTAEWLRASS
jgi:hypothetical protein